MLNYLGKWQMKKVNVMQQTKMNNALSRPCSLFLWDKDLAAFALFSTSCESTLLSLLVTSLFAVITTLLSWFWIQFWSVDGGLSFVAPWNKKKKNYGFAHEYKFKKWLELDQAYRDAWYKWTGRFSSLFINHRKAFYSNFSRKIQFL